MDQELVENVVEIVKELLVVLSLLGVGRVGPGVKNELTGVRTAGPSGARSRGFWKSLRRRPRSGPKAAASEQLPKVISLLDKLVKKNIIHKNKAANLKSKLTKHVNKLA